MAEILINNYSDDSQIKKFMNQELAPRVFHDIPLSALNSGFFSLVSEYISQITEQLGFSSAFYFNESFITKAVLPDSIYAEAAIFNIGYSFATPASTNFLLELKIEDIHKNAVYNADNGLYEFILDKNTKFNLPEGYVYSLDYDILIQYKNIETSTIDAVNPAWNIQYINREEENVCATNKNIYITYRVTDIWLCLLIQANEYERQVHTIVNNTTGEVPNEDAVITCENHIAGFDVKYIDSKGNEQWLPHDHILAIHDTVTDNDPYIHYIMDNPQTIRFMFQLNGNRYFVPESNSSFEITIYTCHGKAANAPEYKNTEQPGVITAANKYTNNGNVMKAAFVISGCVGGTDIGTMETVRRETIEAYNTANVISTDHDIDEWFKTFYFKNILYPYFFKRRDDPWGRVWSGYIALTNNDDYIYRTNTLHARISYDELYNNANNTISSNEIIIPPGWVWVYTDEDHETEHPCLYTVVPYTKGNGVTIESVNTLASIADKFVFANPFGIRIQKTPFAIGYFNPWVNENVTATKIVGVNNSQTVDNNNEDTSYIYHATPIMTNIKRTYAQDHYIITSYILPNISGKSDGGKLVQHLRVNAMAPQFVKTMWNYFKEPLDMYGVEIPLMKLSEDEGYIPFDPERTYFCVNEKNRIDENKWNLTGISIEDLTSPTPKVTNLSITASSMYLYGTDDIWGDDGICEPVYASGDATINIYPALTNEDPITFTRVPTQNYYEMRLSDKAPIGTISKIVVGEAVQTELTKYGEQTLVKIGKSYAASLYINVYYDEEDEHGEHIERQVTYTLTNSANVYMPYMWDEEASEFNKYVFKMENVGSTGIILYADMRPSPDSGSVEYYRIPFSALDKDKPMFYIHSEQFPMFKNEMRVVMSTISGGSETGRVEMQPISQESDGTYVFETTMYPLTELIDIDNRITISSVDNGGGSWKAVNGEYVSLDASDPQIKITILIKSDDPNRDSDIEIGDSFTGYRIMDEYMLDDVDLVQELKEMRSVVDFGESSIPTAEQRDLYNNMMNLDKYDSTNYNLYYLTKYAYDKTIGLQPSTPFNEFQNATSETENVLKTYIEQIPTVIDGYKPDPENMWEEEIISVMDEIVSFVPGTMIYVPLTKEPDDFDPTKYYKKTITDDYIHGIEGETWDSADTWYDYIEYVLDWNNIYDVFNRYPANVTSVFDTVNVNGGMTIQLVPFVEYSLMKSDKFEDFVASFTQVHKAIEPVIFKRLEGNNYLDCKLIATYGKPHTYASDLNAPYDNRPFWPDLSIQIEFDVKLYNQALATNTINELRLIVKSYFNRITSVHTPVDAISMDNNIYISHVIQQMEAHDNVAWMKFKGWYTNEKNKSNGNYMDANTQAIVQKWQKLEDMPTRELERFTPEMFVLDEDNIVINIIK